MNDQPILQFNPKLPRLSSSEKAVLKLLVEAGKLIAPIYLEQENQAKKGPTQAEIEKWGKKDPEILSPYTVVEKVNGKLVATPYHIKYAKLLAPVADKLNKAANTTDNKEFAKALRVQAKALLDGSYEEATATWLKLKPYILDISIGPLDHHAGHLILGKAAYHTWVGVIEQEGTERYNNYKAITLSARRKTIKSAERIDTDKVKAKVIDVILFSGIMARTKYVGINLPWDSEIVGKYGTQAILFNQPNDLRIKEEILPTFNKIFTPAFKEGFSKEDLRRGYLRNVALHELAHAYLYYKNAAKNLEDFFPLIQELAATLLGLRLAGSLLLKDRITEKMLESMMVTYISRSYYLRSKGARDGAMTNYVLGSTIFLNFLLENGTLRESKGILFPNFMKIYVSIHELDSILENLLSQGTRKEAESFVKKYTL